MKSQLLLFFLIVITQTASAQMRKEIFCVGVMGMGKTTWLMNKNISDLPAGEQEQELTFGGEVGLTISTYFSENVGIGLDILYASQNQKYNGVIDETSKSMYNSKVKMSMLNIPLYLRLSTNYGAYFEIGSVFGFVTSSKYVLETSFPHLSGTRNIKSETAGFNIAPMFGLGIDIDLTDRLILTPGLRFSYGVTDIKGVDGKGKSISEYPDYKASHTMNGGLQVSVVYRIEK